MSLKRNNGFFEPLGSFLKWLTDAVTCLRILVTCLSGVCQWKKDTKQLVSESELESKSDSESGLESGNWHSFPDEHSVQSSNIQSWSSDEQLYFSTISCRVSGRRAEAVSRL